MLKVFSAARCTRFLVVLFLAFSLSISTAFSKEAAKPKINLGELRTDARKTFKDKVGPFVKTYCSKCHGSRAKAGINLLSALKNPGSASAFVHWKKSVANVKVNDMPPEEDVKKIPTPEERQQFIKWIDKLKYLAEKDPGPYVIRRLTKAEYANTLHDLYGVDPSITDNLPDEVIGEGFINSISPMQSELYLEIANKVVNTIVPPKGEGPTSIQLKLFGGTPSKGVDLRQRARGIARSLARDAYRRPASEFELDTLVDIFDLGRENKLSYTDSLGLMLKAVLVSPQFLFITPSEVAKPKEKIVKLDDYQLASRLSYMLWAAPPDAELSALADKGELSKTAVLRAQADRLLSHPRSRALFDGFGAQWLRITGLEKQAFDPKVFPQMTPELRKAMMEEARLLFESILRENKSVVRFVDSDYTFLNEPLAKLYGLKTSVKGSKMRRVKLENGNRGGILGMPAVLAATSFPNRTSPVKRGVWVLEQILGERVPPAPANVPELEEQEHKNVEGLSLRQRFELHQSEPTCANCHKVLDPIGFGMENFDAIGEWRDKNEVGAKIDSAGKLPNGEAFSGPRELKTLLAKEDTKIARNMTERLMAFALGRQLEGYDEIVIDQLMEKISKDKHRLRTIILEVVTSYLYTHRRIKE
ncbi:MAG: DUF1592 domain-containing protein [Lentisphaeraceae bacterium]|nr:DUF1592 domain-containing protein [Lentisphaeraceae bacterium]